VRVHSMIREDRSRFMPKPAGADIAISKGRFAVAVIPSSV
jgi:hypothetical protein